MAFSGIGAGPRLRRVLDPPAPGRPGAARAELLLLGEPLDAARALELGHRHQGRPRRRAGAPRPRELAVRLARGPDRAYAATKRALDYAASSSLADALALEADLQDACAKTDDHLNATRAFLNKERRVFEGR